jgi:hypothetical protein
MPLGGKAESRTGEAVLSYCIFDRGVATAKGQIGKVFGSCTRLLPVACSGYSVSLSLWPTIAASRLPRCKSLV